MQEKRYLLNRLINRKRVGISPKNYLKKLRNITFIFLGITALSFTLNFYLNGLTYTGLIGCVCCLGIIGSVGFYFQRYAKSTAVKGDTLILNSIKKKESCVTSLRSVKEVKTISFLGLHWTNLQYKLDGVSKKVIIFNRASSVIVRPEIAIKKAIRLSKKQKANHKPDPVTVP